MRSNLYSDATRSKLQDMNERWM